MVTCSLEVVYSHGSDEDISFLLFLIVIKFEQSAAQEYVFWVRKSYIRSWTILRSTFRLSNSENQICLTLINIKISNNWLYKFLLNWLQPPKPKTSYFIKG
jgi:hypothetical protein